MAETRSPIPPPLDGENDDVALALATASALWKKGDAQDSLRWLRRAAESAEEAGDDMRALSLARKAADLTTEIQGGGAAGRAQAVEKSPPAASKVDVKTVVPGRMASLSADRSAATTSPSLGSRGITPAPPRMAIAEDLDDDIEDEKTPLDVRASAQDPRGASSVPGSAPLGRGSAFPKPPPFPKPSTGELGDPSSPMAASAPLPVSSLAASHATTRPATPSGTRAGRVGYPVAHSPAPAAGARQVAAPEAGSSPTVSDPVIAFDTASSNGRGKSNGSSQAYAASEDVHCAPAGMAMLRGQRVAIAARDDGSWIIEPLEDGEVPQEGFDDAVLVATEAVVNRLRQPR